jgi:hypothetical protein
VPLAELGLEGVGLVNERPRRDQPTHGPPRRGGVRPRRSEGVRSALVGARCGPMSSYGGGVRVLRDRGRASGAQRSAATFARGTRRQGNTWSFVKTRPACVGRTVRTGADWRPLTWDYYRGRRRSRDLLEASSAAGGQGAAGSNPVVPTARWAVPTRRGSRPSVFLPAETGAETIFRLVPDDLEAGRRCRCCMPNWSKSGARRAGVPQQMA